MMRNSKASLCLLSEVREVNNLIASDMRRMLKNKFFYIFTFIVPVVTILIELAGILGVRLLDIESPVCADQLLAFYEGRYACLIPALFVALFTGHELVTGCIRNKITSGSSRIACLMSSVICSIPTAVITQLVAHIIAQLSGLILGETFADIKLTLSFLVLRICATIAVTVLCVALSYIFSTSVISYIAGGVAAAAFVILNLDIQLKLYPLEGEVVIKGAKLVLYDLMDKYVPFCYTNTPVLKDAGTYAVGICSTIVISLVLSALIFRRKDLK